MSINDPSVESQQHEMQLQITHSSGAEEWYCPTCGRRLLMHWQPERQNLDMLVLEAGDELIRHIGSTGGLRIGKSEVVTLDEEPVLSNELRAALDDVLEHIDFDGWSSTADQ